MSVPAEAIRPAQHLARHGRTMFSIRKGDIRLGTVLACTLGIAICLLGGIYSGHAALGMIAASGALSVGFGSVQRFTRLRAAPMIFATVGMTLAAAIGSALGNVPIVFLLFSGLMAALCGSTNLVGIGAWWITLQWTIAFFVAGAYPSDVEGTASRAALVFGGCVLQLVLVMASWALRGEPALIRDYKGEERWQDLFVLMARELPKRPEVIRFAAASAIMTMVATGTWQELGIPNGYWIPMTALIVLRPVRDTTIERSFYRLAGTLTGSVLATALTALLRPGEHLLAAMVIFMAFVSFLLQRSGYAIFAASVTALVAFLVSLAGIPELAVVEHRILATLVGGGLAMITSVLLREADE